MQRIGLEAKWMAIVFSLLLTVVFVWLAVFPPLFFRVALKRLDYISYDLRLNLLLSKKPAPKNPIVIVDIDERSIKAEGRWPWSRDKLARLVQQLYNQGATVIAFDILLSEPERDIATLLLNQLQMQKLATPEMTNALERVTPYFDNDAIFANTLTQGKDKIVLGIFFSENNTVPVGLLPPPTIDLQAIGDASLNLPRMQSYIANIALFQQAAGHAGALSIIPDEDGTVRRYSLLQRYGDNLYPSLALEAMQLYLLVQNISLNTVQIGQQKVINNINLGRTQIDTDADGRVFIPYLGPEQTFPYYSATDVMNNKLPPHQLQNALVFIGTSAIGLGDMRSTPVESVYPGVEIHANIAEALFANRFPYVPAWAPGAQLALIIFLGIFLSILFTYIGPFWIIIDTVVTIGLIFSGSVWLWHSDDLVLPIVLSILMVCTLAVFNMAFGFFAESRRRNELKRVFEQYVPSARVAEIANHPEAVSTFEGERKVMSVLFMDIRNFTAISEKLAIGDLKKLLNFFLTEMTGIIFKHGGTIDKYVGDMIMAFWGAPLSDQDHAKHALLAALDMLNTTNNLQEKLTTMNLPNIRVGIGVNTGVMDVGDMGSNFRRAYTVLGDAVNLASRLESLTKYYGAEIIVGETTYVGQDEIVFRQLDKVKVIGKHKGVAIYQPMGLRTMMRPEQMTELQTYEKALDAYYHRDWAAAKKYFSDLQKEFPSSVLYQLYISRINAFEKEPPAPDWDGMWELQAK